MMNLFQTLPLVLSGTHCLLQGEHITVDFIPIKWAL